MKYFVLGIITSLITYLFVYIATNSFLFGTIICVIFLLYFLLYGSNKLRKHYIKRKEYENCLTFINNYLLFNNKEPNLKEKINLTLDTLSKDFQNKRQQYEFEILCLESLKPLFNFSIFDLFVSMNKQEDFDNILLLTYYEKQNLVNKSEKIRKNIIKFSLLWTMPMVAFVIVKLLLSKFYKSIIETPLFLVGVCVIFGFLLLSIHLFIQKIIKFDYEVTYEKN